MAGNILKVAKTIIKTAEKITINANNGDVVFNAAKGVKYSAKKNLLYSSYVSPEANEDDELQVKKVTCDVAEVILGKKYTFKAVQFSRKPKPGGKELENVKWAYKIDDEDIQEFPKKGRVVVGSVIKQITISDEFRANKKLTIYAYLENLSEDVSVELPIVSFPFCVDRFKMPGLNEDLTNIAEDLTYGKGVANKAANNVYEAMAVEQFKQEYIESGFDINKHAIFANSEKLQEKPLDKSFNYTTPPKGSDHFASVQRDHEQYQVAMKQMSENYDIDSYPKSIYSKERIYNSLAPIIDGWFGGLLNVNWNSGGDVKDYNEGSTLHRDISDENIFKKFEHWATLCFSYGELQGNIERMITKFKRNEGGIYEDLVLTEDIANHKATLEYCRNLEDFIAEKIKGRKGRLSEVAEDDIDDNYDKRRDRGKTTAKNTPFAKPTFGSLKDSVKGERIALNDIWATEVYITGAEFDSDNYTIDYRVTLWDHFGLNISDIEKTPNAIPFVKQAFAAWFALQHLRGYKPFITKITFDKTFTGNITQGKLERAKLREDKRLKQEVEYTRNPLYKSQGKI